MSSSSSEYACTNEAVTFQGISANTEHGIMKHCVTEVKRSKPPEMLFCNEKDCT